MSRRNGAGLTVVNGSKPAQTELVAGDANFVRAPDVERIADLIRQAHPMTFDHLRNFNRLLLFKKGTPPKKDEGESFIHTIARAFKAPALWADVSGYHAGFWVWEWWWEKCDQAKREALVMHELLHIGMAPNGSPRMEKHDVEDFALVVRHYGRWSEGVQLYAQQLALFEQQPAAH